MANKQQDLSGDLTVVVPITAQATAGNGDTWTLIPAAPNDIEIVGISVAFDTAVTGDDTDNFILEARNEGTDGTGTTGVSDPYEFATGTDAVAQVPVDLVMSTTDGETDLDEGETLSLVRTVSGTGLASPRGMAQITYRNR